MAMSPRKMMAIPRSKPKMMMGGEGKAQKNERWWHGYEKDAWRWHG
jgi:hypothetical protein